MIVLKRGTKLWEPLTWMPFTDDEKPGALNAGITCGNGHHVSLHPTEHEIADDGTVTPSLDCPVEGCSWHESVKLEGWVPG